MVQLQNADRLNQVIKFGTIQPEEDINGSPVKKFVQIGKPTLCGDWKLTTNQIIQNEGLDRKKSFIIICHHYWSFTSIKFKQKIILFEKIIIFEKNSKFNI